MNQHYEPEFKKKIVRLHLEEGRSLKGLAAEYGVSKNLFEKSITLMAEWMGDRKSTRLNSSHRIQSRMPSSA